MAAKRPTTIAEYIRAAPAEGQPHLRQLHALLRSVAPKATGTIKWGSPFFVEPRFLFAFSAYKAHISFAPTATSFKAFAKELEAFQTTKGTLRIPYDEPFPAGLVRKIARYCVKELRARESDSFW